MKIVDETQLPASITLKDIPGGQVFRGCLIKTVGVYSEPKAPDGERLYLLAKGLRNGTPFVVDVETGLAYSGVYFGRVKHYTPLDATLTIRA